MRPTGKASGTDRTGSFGHAYDQRLSIDCALERYSVRDTSTTSYTSSWSPLLMSL